MRRRERERERRGGREAAVGLHALDDGEAYQENVRAWVTQGPHAVIVLLPGRVPQAERHGLVRDDHLRAVVIKNGGNVLAREGVGRVAGSGEEK